jgi:hypothetical protein
LYERETDENLTIYVSGAMTDSQQVYAVRPRKDKRGVDLISDVLPFKFKRLWYGAQIAISNAIGYAKLYSRSPRCCDSCLRRVWQCDRDGKAGPSISKLRDFLSRKSRRTFLMR